MDWAALGVGGAFAVGIVVGAAAVLRVTRYLLEYLRHEHDREHRQ